MYGYLGLCNASESNVCHILANGEPLYDAYTTYLPVTNSIDRKPRDWGLARSAYSIKYGKGGNKFGADFRIPETQMELNEIAWFY